MLKIWKRILPALVSYILLSACGNVGDKKEFNVTPPDSDSPDPSLNIESSAYETSTPENPSPSVPESPYSPPDSDSSGTPDTAPSGESDEDDIVEIGEKMFLTQINDMNCNFDNYKDKTIIIEGMYAQFYLWDGSKTVPVLYRNAPGCCGNDGWGGLLLKYDGELPNDNDWIRATGTLELVEEDHFLNLYLNISSLEVKEERGAEFVTQ